MDHGIWFTTPVEDAFLETFQVTCSNGVHARCGTAAGPGSPGHPAAPHGAGDPRRRRPPGGRRDHPPGPRPPRLGLHPGGVRRPRRPGPGRSGPADRARRQSRAVRGAKRRQPPPRGLPRLRADRRHRLYGRLRAVPGPRHRRRVRDRRGRGHLLGTVPGLPGPARLRLSGAESGCDEASTVQPAQAGSCGTLVSVPDLGLFGPESVTWKLHAEPILLLAGLRALYLQALHPQAMAGVNQNSQFKRDPWGRLLRTSVYLATVVYGTTEQAYAAGARVRAVHGRMRAIDPRTGEFFRVDEPRLLRWVHVTEVESFASTAVRAGLAVTPDEIDRYYAEQRPAAELVGLDPATVPGSAAEGAPDYAQIRPGPCPA